MIKVLPTCVAEVVCSEAFLNTWSDFWNKTKTKKIQKKKSSSKKPSNEKIASSVTELIDFVAFLVCCFVVLFCFVFFQNGLTKI